MRFICACMGVTIYPTGIVLASSDTNMYVVASAACIMGGQKFIAR